MFSTGKKAIAIILVIVTLLGVNLSASAQGTDASQASQSALAFVVSHTAEWSSWEGATPGAGLPLTDVQGRQIAYVFPVVKSGQTVGRVVVGNSLYHFIVLEAGGTPLPSPAVSDMRTVLATDLALGATDAELSQPQRTMYLGYAQFVRVYEVSGELVGVGLYFKHASLVTDLVSNLTPPEQMTFSGPGIAAPWADIPASTSMEAKTNTKSRRKTWPVRAYRPTSEIMPIAVRRQGRR